jgi:hypothetical protein
MAASRRTLAPRADAPSCVFGWDGRPERVAHQRLPGAPPVRSRGGDLQTRPQADDVLAPPGETPRYYGAGWQVLLWLAVTVLVLLMFG